MKPFYLLLLSLTCCYGYINDFYINITFPGFRQDTVRSFIIDTVDADEFIWQSQGYDQQVGGDYTYDETKSRTYRAGDYLYKSGFLDGGKYCNLEGSMIIDNFALLPYKNYNAYFGLVKNSTCGANALHRTTAFNGKQRAGRLSIIKERILRPTNGDSMIRDFRVAQICLHITVTHDLKIKQTGVAVGAKLAADRIIGEHYYSKDRYWRVPATSFKVGDTEYNVTYRYNTATFHTTYDKIRLPYGFFDPIAAAVNATYVNETAKWMVDCDKRVPLEIGLNKMKFNIQFDALLRQAKPEDKQCELLLERNPDKVTNYFTLGVPFFVNNGVCFGNRGYTMTFYNAKYDPSSPIFPDTFGAYVSVYED